YEFNRQLELLEKGERIIQETRGWDDSTGRTFSQRSKENAPDYRYMPDPDIPPIVISDKEVARIQSEVLLLPADYRKAWQPLGLDRSVVDSLLANPSYAGLVKTVQDNAGDETAKRVAHWFASNVDKDQEDTATVASNFVPESYIELADMVDAGELSS